MKVLVDTCIWSMAFRRKNAQDNIIVVELGNLIKEVRVQLIGPIRQELLSGIKSTNQFETLRNYLSAFPDYMIRSNDFEKAGEFFNSFRNKGIQGSNTDFLICAISYNNNWPIFTIDKDFSLFQKIVPIKLYKPRA